MNHWLIAVFFISELINSFCADNRGKWVVRGQPRRADAYDLISSIITVTVPFFIYVVEKDLRYAVPVVIASVIGTHMATIGVYFKRKFPFIGKKYPFWGVPAKSQAQKKSTYRRKQPFTSA